jgi:hypothetical protein
MDPADGEIRTRSAAPVGPDEPGPSVLGPLFDSSFYLMDNWLAGLLRVAFGSDDPAIAYANVLEGLKSDHTSAQDSEEGEIFTESEPELSAIEQEVSRLLADRDCDPEPPPSI